MTPQRILTPLVALGLLAAALPVRLPVAGRGASADACLALADAPAQRELVLLERCVALYPDDAEMLGDLGAAYEAQGQRTRAEAVYTRALSVDPDYAELRLRLARLLLKRGAAVQASIEAGRALQMQPNRRELLALRAAADAAAGEAR